MYHITLRHFVISNTVERDVFLSFIAGKIRKDSTVHPGKISCTCTSLFFRISRFLFFPRLKLSALGWITVALRISAVTYDIHYAKEVNCNVIRKNHVWGHVPFWLLSHGTLRSRVRSALIIFSSFKFRAHLTS